MDAEEFWKRVSTRAGLHNRDQAKAATEVALSALQVRITPESGDHLAAQLPAGIKEQWKHAAVEHMAAEAGGFERMDLEEFIDRVQQDPVLKDQFNAREVIRAVFMTLQEQITPGASQKLAGELPRDIREFWLSSVPETTPSEKEPVGGRKAGETTGLGGMPTSEMEEEVPVLGPEYDVPTGADMSEIQALEAGRKRPPEGEYTSEEIGPSAATVYRSDQQVKAEVEDLLEANDEIDSSGIQIESHTGRVILRGWVRSSQERETAKHVAREALGVVEVIDELEVED